MRKASAARKSRGEIKPGAGRNLNPVQSINRQCKSQHSFNAGMIYREHHPAY